MTEWLTCPKCGRQHPENSVKLSGEFDPAGKQLFVFYCFYCLTFFTEAPGSYADI